jgi:hypothetical protein
MAWEISHGPEAWENVRRNLENWLPEGLIEALCDAEFEKAEANGEDAASAADARRVALTGLPLDILVDACLSEIGEHNTCSNGGFDFWIDPEGFHTVPCDLADNEEATT